MRSLVKVIKYVLLGLYFVITFCTLIIAITFSLYERWGLMIGFTMLWVWLSAYSNNVEDWADRA